MPWINRVSLTGIQPLNYGKFVAAEVFYTCTWGDSNWPLHEQVQHVPPGRVVYVDVIGCDGRAVFGDIVAKWLMLYKKSVGIVVNGFVRDIHRLRKEDYPIWCTGGTPLGCMNLDVPVTEKIDAHIKEQRRRFDGGILVADDSGCTLVTPVRQTKALLDRLNFIELQEDIWYFCTDTLKMSTYETICMKRYLQSPEILPNALRHSLDLATQEKE